MSALKTLKQPQSQAEPADLPLRIGALAKRAGVTVETVRYYEQRGLIAAVHRDAQGYRLFDLAQVATLAFIRHCRSLGLSLDDFARLQQAARNPSDDCRCIDHLLARHLETVRARIQALQNLEVQLQRLGTCCDDRGHPVRDCGILRELTAAACSDAQSRRR